jgi:DNA-binding NtrC family response regulator
MGVRPPRILLVDDDDDQRRSLAELLQAQGYAVTGAANAESALERLQVESFDLLISDYQLGGATGTWLARVAGGSLQQPPPAVLIMTGHDVVVDVNGLTVLQKPLDIGRFTAEVEHALAFRPEAQPPTLAAERIALVLYLSNSLPSRRTKKTVETVLAEYDPAQVALTIVNLGVRTAHEAEQHRVVATPTLLKTFPAPRVWIAGDCSDPDVVRRILDQAGVERRT